VECSWNGCAENPEGEIVECWQGYPWEERGFGLFVEYSEADWLIERSDFSYNTMSGLIMGFDGNEHGVELLRSTAEGNAASQIDIFGPAKVVNGLFIGNCAHFDQYDFDVESCLFGGSAVRFGLFTDMEAYLVNSTVVGHGASLLEVESFYDDWYENSSSEIRHDEDEDWENELVVFNNIFVGYEGPFYYPELPLLIFDLEYLEFELEFFKNLIWGVQDLEEICFGGDNICENPQFEDEEDFDFQLTEGSAAIDEGVTRDDEDIVPTVDFLSNKRPSGDGVDLGAFEFQW
jgi:hypothetical protein